MSKREWGDGVTHWAEAHEALVQLARERCEVEGREGRALLLAMRSGAHVHLGYGGFAEYVERLFGYTPRTTFDKLRTAEALETLPELDSALTQGELTWSAARELARVATPQTERQWIDASKGKTVRDVERLIAGHERGDLPSDAARLQAVRHVLRFEVAAETLATFRHAMKELCQQSGEHLDDDAALLLMARHILGRKEPLDGGAGADAGRASYQLALTLCEHCQRGFQDAGAERVEVDATIVEMARCDAQHIGHVRSRGVPLDSATPDSATSLRGKPPHVGRRETLAPRRATQTIPPALRRHVLCRDQGRCVLPGCRHTIFVDLHHIELRSDGGEHDADNLVVLCSAHHRAVHQGQLDITGLPSTGLRFAHADGTPYGNTPSPHTVAVVEQVFRGLRGLGFKEREARRALDAASKELSAKLTAPAAQDLLRAALGRLGPRSVRSEAHDTHAQGRSRR